MRRPSLLGRQLRIQLGLLALAWLVLGAVTLGGIFAAGSGLLDRDIRTTSEALARFASVSPTPGEAGSVIEHLAAMVARTSHPPPRLNEVAFRVWDQSGALLARSDDPLPDLSWRTAQEPMDVAEGWRIGGASSPDGRVHAVIGFSAGYLERLRGQSIRNLLLPFAALSLFLAAGSWIAARSGLAPLRRLAQQIDQRAPGDLRPVDASAPYAEIEPIMRALNDQLQATARRLETERRFFAEAAHELRTPLAVLSAQAHVVANESSERGRREALAALEAGIERSGRVVGRLLTLARLDAPPPPDTFAPLDAGGLAEEIASALSARAAASGHALELAASDPVILEGSEEALRAALENLVDNALRYTPPGTTIKLSVRRLGDECVIEVADDGPGIAPALHDRVFGRFERLGRQGGDGTGLGLAIVRRVAEIHGGQAEFRPGPDGRGCLFRLRLPIGGRPAP